MTDTLVNKSTAILATNLGFPVVIDPSYTYWSNTIVHKWDWFTEEYFIDAIPAMSQSALQKWLRDSNIIALVHNYTGKYCCDIEYLNHKHRTTYYDTYEEALETGLRRSLYLLDKTL